MSDDLHEFIATTFGSVWALELLLFLYRHDARRWTPAELVSELRSSERVVSESTQALFVAGLVDVSPDGAVSYRASSDEVHALVTRLDDLYRRKASTVRRAVIQTGNEKLQTFADAFKIRKPPA